VWWTCNIANKGGRVYKHWCDGHVTWLIRGELTPKLTCKTRGSGHKVGMTW
jgi:hypothetical protein